MRRLFRPLLLSLLTAVLLPATPAPAQGMPPEARDNIQRLFDRHAAIQRSVTLTATGYSAITESEDPVIAGTLRAHVDQMRARLEAGLGVRQWDPAYAEMSRHYADLDLKVEPTAKGLRVVMTGRTPAAVKVAQNHAQIVSKFAAHGWAEHDVSHPAVANTEVTPSAPSAGEKCSPGGPCCSEEASKGTSAKANAPAAP